MIYGYRPKRPKRTVLDGADRVGRMLDEGIGLATPRPGWWRDAAAGPREWVQGARAWSRGMTRGGAEPRERVVVTPEPSDAADAPAPLAEGDAPLARR